MKLLLNTAMWNYCILQQKSTTWKILKSNYLDCDVSKVSKLYGKNTCFQPVKLQSHINFIRLRLQMGKMIWIRIRLRLRSSGFNKLKNSKIITFWCSLMSTSRKMKWFLQKKIFKKFKWKSSIFLIKLISLTKLKGLTTFIIRRINCKNV
jgi:hypothetical protein